MRQAPPRTDPNSLLPWIRRAQQGDDEAFEDLVQRFAKPLRRAVARRLGSELGQHLDADDIVQETFLAAFLAIERYEARAEASFFSWLMRIAMRKLRDAVRFHRREKRTPQAVYFAATLDPESGRPAHAGEFSGGDDPLERLGNRELEELALHCLRQLSPELREVVLLRDCRDIPWKAIAQLLGRRTIGAVRHLHIQACGELARQMTLMAGGRVGLGLS